MAMKAILVVTLVTAVGDPSFPPMVISQENMESCQAAARATVEALALAHEERLLPARVPLTPIAAKADANGAWFANYDRATRADPSKNETVVARNVRAICRPTS